MFDSSPRYPVNGGQLPSRPASTLGVKAGNLREILRDIRELNNLGIYVGNVQATNFKGGKLVDFGLSSTVPHCIMESLDKEGGS
jgi:hypothetical protein